MSRIYSPLLKDLVQALTVLPGVGPKSAQRMAMQLLERQREGGMRLAKALELAMQNIGHCASCRSYAEEKFCEICSDARRDETSICVVETPSDVAAIESSGAFSGRYFVLMGRLSPLDGMGPKELGFDLLEQQVRDNGVKEIILATNSNVEGEATAHYLAEVFKESDVTLTRIAQGVPLGGELDYVDGGTLERALRSRQQM